MINDYWNLIVSYSIWQEIIKNEKYISSYDNFKIQKNDIIMIYVRQPKDSGYMGIIKANSHQKKNSKVKVFKDMNLNNYCVKNKYLIELTKVIKVEDIIDTIEDETVGYRSQQSYKRKFLIGSNNFIKLNKSKGSKILNKILHINNINIDSPEKEKVVKNPKKVKLVKKQNDDIKEEKPKKQEIKSKYINLIPIIITPCNDFDISIKEERMSRYCIKHFRHCNKCEWTNNNNVELFGNIKKDNINYEVVDDTDKDYLDAKDAHLNLTKYFCPNKDNMVQIWNIDDDDIFTDCIMIVWRIHNSSNVN